MIKAKILGCGTSHGVPMVACFCPVCQSPDPRNHRTRCSLLLESPESTLLVDAPPELRLQLTREQVRKVDAVLITHSHADHVMGLDDIRRFNELMGKPMPLFAQPSVLDDIQRIFRYAFVPPSQEGGGLPSYELHPVPEILSLPGMEVKIFEVLHGRLPVLGLRVGNFAYITDVSEIPEKARRALEGVEVLVLDATREAPHPSHFHRERAVEVAQALGARQTFLTHLSHDYDYETSRRALPPGIDLCYDGLEFWVPGA